MTHHTPDDGGHRIAQIATVVAARLPGADVDRLTGQIAALKLLPHHAGDLLEYLDAHPEALTSGAATGPSALRRLLDVLAADHPAVQRMRCNGCRAQTRLPYRRDGASICGNCYRRAHLKVCVRCGQMGQPAFREAGGTVCIRCMARDPAHKHACARCGTIARIAYRVDGQPLCQKCGPRKLYTCSSCGRDNQTAHAFSVQGPICSTCYHRSREHQCVQCGRTTVHARVADQGAGQWICNRCWTPPTLTCTSCGHLKPCDRGSASHNPTCSTCRSRRRPPRTCAVCARSVKPQTTLPVGPVCGPCYRQLRRSPATCAGCQEIRPLVGVGDNGLELCGPCSGDDRNWVCSTCGRVDLLFAGSECIACSVKRRVRELLTGPAGQIAPQLDGVATFLLTDRPFEQTHHLFNGTAWVQLLGELVSAGRPITHELLDDLPQDNHVRHLRSILVHTGALGDQGEGLESLQPWLKSFLAGLSPQTAKLLRPYASWSVLPRARQRAARRGITASAPAYARDRIGAAAHFLTWLEHNHRTLADATQHDVNTWLGQGASTRHRIRDFLRWAHARGLAADLQVHWLGSEGLPEQVLGDDERWTLLRRCLHDDRLDLRLRVAGALVLLYGQIPSRIVELTNNSLTTTETDTYLVLRNQPVLLPPPLAALTVELATLCTQEQPTTSEAGTQTWLFPGARPGSHLYAGRLSTSLNQKVGIFIRPARGAALSALAADLPAPVLADLLGISIETAARWGALAARDNADYVAARITNPPANGLQPVTW